MEALDKEWSRQQRRLDPDQVLKPAEVHTVADIKALVSKFDPAKDHAKPELPLSTQIVSKDVGSNQKPTIYQVSATTKSKSQRDMLLEGLELIKKRLEMQANDDVEPVKVNGKVMQPISLGNGVEGYSWVDSLIKQWLGGYREGTNIYWDLSDGYKYEYNIFEHNLSRFKAD